MLTKILTAFCFLLMMAAGSSCRRDRKPDVLPPNPYTLERFDGKIVKAIKCADGNFAVIGFSEDLSMALFAKLDEGRHIILEKHYSKWELAPTSLSETSDGSFVFAGITAPTDLGFSIPRRVGLRKLDKEGNTIWMHGYGDTLWYDPMPKAISTQQNEHLLTYKYMANGNDALLVMKLNAEGDSIWQHEYNENDNEAPVSILQTTDNNFLLTALFMEGNHKAYLLKINSDGDQLWRKEISILNTNLFIAGTKETTSGELLVYGMTKRPDGSEPRTFLRKLSAYGEEIWQTSFGTDTSEEPITYLQEDGKGGYIATGYRNFAQQSTIRSTVTMISFAGDGSLQWQRRYDDLPPEGIAAFPMKNGYYLFGSTRGFFAPAFYFIKYTNTDGGEQ